MLKHDAYSKAKAGKGRFISSYNKYNKKRGKFINYNRVKANTIKAKIIKAA